MEEDKCYADHEIPLTATEGLNAQVSQQILHAEGLEDTGASETERSRAWGDVSQTEEAIAGLSDISDIEVAIAKRGAISAADKSGDAERAALLRQRFGPFA